MSNTRVTHSAQVSMVLHLEGGQDVRLSQMGPDFIILREALAVNSPPQDASITLKVDDHSALCLDSNPGGGKLAICFSALVSMMQTTRLPPVNVWM